MKVIDSICFLLFPLRKLSGAFRLTASKSLYPQYFKKMENLACVGQIPDFEYYYNKRDEWSKELNVSPGMRLKSPRSLIKGEFWSLIARTMLLS
jgi:hypothetical protein